MKVKLRKPISWFGPYQLADALCFWTKKEKDEIGMDREPDWVYDFGTWLAGEKNDTWLTKFLQWYDKVRRKFPWNQDVIVIDYWDTWSMDYSLSPIILPMLKQLKATTHGAPNVDDDDVPEELKSTTAPPKENKYDTDGNHFKRWDYVLDEMIFAFECKVDDSWQDQFRSGEIDHTWIPIDKDGKEVPKGEHTYYQMGQGPKHTYKCDYDGMEKVQKRISNGFRLFGKYYEGLWD